MSALVERIISLRDDIKSGRGTVTRVELDILADSANALTERDQTIHALRQRLERFEALSTVEFYNCAVYVGEAKSAIQGADRGRELARMIRTLFERNA